jgi:hypothetical protein
MVHIGSGGKPRIGTGQSKSRDKEERYSTVRANKKMILIGIQERKSRSNLRKGKKKSGHFEREKGTQKQDFFSF